MSLVSSNAIAATSCVAEWQSDNYIIENCINGETLTFGGTTFETCYDCANGLASYAVTVSDSQCTNKATKYLCPKQCTKTTVDSYILDNEIDNCTNESIIQFGNKQFHTCDDCDFGYRVVAELISNETCSNTTTIYKCEEIPAEEQECNDDSDCSGNTLATSTDGSKVEIGTYGWCSNDMTCTYEEIYWFCNDGYWGSGYGNSEDDITCTLCPEHYGTPGYSYAPYNNTYVTDCYVPANTSFNDEQGTYEFTERCYASN